ncbi:DUF2141 domain-containing protein [Breznakiella homolactica]|uniref:DUF2141 domain-containing protein n=1 Tax=Breznakiella homolactica TaxID=2798577 RepID=A0A7T7XQ41_9SPIR|nr:DUF2141 domain-containing protein [Breznakiella homolactica]QQO10456.1 DUF2141 domain-containing protein [Breznakiella homolactica]
MSSIKKPILFFFLVFLELSGLSADVPVTLEIRNVVRDGGTVYAAIATGEEFRSKSPGLRFEISPDSETAVLDVSVPEGEYGITVYQDRSGNNQLDTGFLGIPREPVGMSNYDGRGIPGGFKKIKVPIHSRTGTITIRLYTF